MIKKVFLGLCAIVIVFALAVGFLWLFAVILAIISLISLLRGIHQKKVIEKMVPSEMRCPNCGSTNIKINKAMTGTSTSSRTSGVGYARSGLFGGVVGRGTSSLNSNTSYNYKREAVCDDCGYNYDYITSSDIENANKKCNTKIVLSSVLLVVGLLCSVFTFNAYFKDSVSNNSLTKDNGKIWASEITPIDNFEYYLDGEFVYIKDYKGKDKKVWIDSSYEIDGQNYSVIEFKDGVFALDNIDSAILPEGLIDLPKNTFNSCGVKNVYIPSTLNMAESSKTFLGYFHNVETINYGGSEEQWNNFIGDTKREDIDAKVIKYDVSINELIGN